MTHTHTHTHVHHFFAIACSNRIMQSRWVKVWPPHSHIQCRTSGETPHPSTHAGSSTSLSDGLNCWSHKLHRPNRPMPAPGLHRPKVACCYDIVGDQVRDRLRLLLRLGAALAKASRAGSKFSRICPSVLNNPPQIMIGAPPSISTGPAPACSSSSTGCSSGAGATREDMVGWDSTLHRICTMARAHLYSLARGALLPALKPSWVNISSSSLEGWLKPSTSAHTGSSVSAPLCQYWVLSAIHWPSVLPTWAK